ncbi:ABC transporter ATP-binding protein [Tenacibaculum halocynthiae]|uniref:ABC transporter ATP-binding protein n=1 Tax=Tenacibaculum halocynthiae TaxID=1254437 RepID=UPI00262C8843|nr:ABC transporter ATP-binding protein [uncultured Tenacibaculum sp.]
MLQAINLSMCYGDKHALKDLNFSVAPGEIFCLLGQNGAGKTTTINIFLGLLKPTSGTATINNSSSLNNSNVRKKIAYIPEIVQLYRNLTGLENLNFFSQLAGFKYSEKELITFLNTVGLQEEAHRKKLATYSKGMRQKVGIAIALSKNAKYILMDEPTSGLDPKASFDFTEICKKLAKNGVGILMATHDIFNAVNVGSRIGIMKQGTIVHTAETSTINAQQLQELYIKTI